MADDKKNIEATTSTVENTTVPEQRAHESVLINTEAVMLEYEEQSVLFELDEAVSDHAAVHPALMT